MLENIFDINNFNILSDDEYYYFFRALNKGDLSDIKNGITSSGDDINLIRTDRERYEGIPKYNEESNISLEEIFDHVKMRHRVDTNCVSLTSNANAAITYGREFYEDEYVTIKVPKNELGKSVYNASLYMMQEIQMIIDSLEINNEVDDLQLYYIRAIEHAKTRERLDEIKETLPKEYVPVDLREKGLEFRTTNTAFYQSLTEEQNFEKDKLILKLDVIKQNIIPNVSNKNLIKTLGNAFSSMELTHYNSIYQDKIIKVNSEIIDMIGLIQQLPKDYPYIDEIKQIVISKLDKKIETTKFEYKDYDLYEDFFTIENIYNLTKGSIDYNEAVTYYKKAFSLAKSKLRTYNTISLLNEILDRDPKYQDTLRYMLNNTYGIEPEITFRQTKNSVNISESVSLDFNNSEKELFDFVNNLQVQDLNYIMNNPNESMNYILNHFQMKPSSSKSKEEYFANSIIDAFDWKSIGIEINFSNNQRNDIVNSLIEHDFLTTYENLKKENIKEKDIARVLLTNVIKNKENIDLKDSFSITELEEFIGYNKIKGTRLQLRNYQSTALKNIDKILDKKQFTTAVLPTGAGKSFVALAKMHEMETLINELNSDNHANILYLAPNEEILNQIKNYIWKFYAEPHIDKSEDELIKKIFPNLTLSTYAYLTSENAENIINDNYDLIVFDELHRTGATEWNKKIDDLLANQNEKTKVLGITATPQRDADLIDMSEHWAKRFGYTKEEILKHEHLAINMDLIEAIRMGYVVNPKLVTCEYNLLQDGSMTKLLESINSIENEDLKQEKIKKYENLRRKIEQANGVDKILSNNLKKGGKYIVFCPITNQNNQLLENIDGNSDSIQDNDVIENYIKYLKDNLKTFIEENNLDADLELEFTSMLGSYSNKDNKTNLENFSNNGTSRTRFMLVMNKLNEGVHVDGIDGIIWLRPMDENSKILYLQQLGRCIYGLDPLKEYSEEEIPTVIDLVNNTLKVRLEKGELETNDLDIILMIKDWIEEHNGNIPDINSSNKVESSYASKLKKLKDKYIKYSENYKLLDELSEEDQITTNYIVSIGNDIGLWNYVFPDKIITNNNVKEQDLEEDDLSIFSLIEIQRDFVELSEEVGNITVLEWVKELINYCENINSDDKWPKRGCPDIAPGGTLTSTQLAQWLKRSGYNAGKFKYNEITYEGRPIKEIIDELKDKYGDYDKKIYIIELINYCENINLADKWPKKRCPDIAPGGTLTSAQLANWLGSSGYNVGNFKYNEITYEGRPIKEIIDELKDKYGRINKQSDESIIRYIIELINYCENINLADKWPKEGKNCNYVAPGGTLTSNQLANWLGGSGYNVGKFKYNEITYEGRPIKEIIDELKDKYGRINRRSDESIIRYIIELINYCENINLADKWPKLGCPDIAPGGTKTSAQLANWLGATSGYNVGKFKYNEITYEGRPIKEIIDELKDKYGDYDKKIYIIELINYCENINLADKWPKLGCPDIAPGGTKTSTQLANWLRDSGYNVGKFKYNEITYEGNPIKEIIDELSDKYNLRKKNFKESKQEFDELSKFSEVSKLVEEKEIDHARKI